MNVKKPDGDRLACSGFAMNLSGLTMTRVILWLVAITIVSLVIGFAILGLSGDLPSSPEKKTSPFRQTSLVTPNTTTIPLDGAATGRMTITMGAGEFSLRGGAGPGQLAEATVYSDAPGGQPEIHASVNGTEKSVTIITKSTRGKNWFAGSPNRWEILVNDQVPVDLTLEIGAGHSELDLGGLNLTALSVSNGAGETVIDLTRTPGGPPRAEIHNGVGELTVRIDRQSNTRIAVHSGVGDVTAAGFEQNDEIYTTKGFDPALPVREISIAQGVGSIQLEAL